jgi:hypothetical protein
MALNPAQGEMVGWPRFVETVSSAWHQIPAGERRHTAIFTGNYGEAGAIDLLGPTHRLPRAYSGHNGFSQWGRPPGSDTHALIVGFTDAADAAPYFEQCRTLATVDNRVGLNNQEQGLPVMLCQPAGPWATLWPQLAHYDSLKHCTAHGPASFPRFAKPGGRDRLVPPLPLADTRSRSLVQRSPRRNALPGAGPDTHLSAAGRPQRDLSGRSVTSRP